MSAFVGQTDFAIGNVVGSNIFNIVGALGLSLVVSPIPITVTETFLGFDLPILILVSAICFPIFFTDHRISRLEGMFFLIFYAIYVFSSSAMICIPYSPALQPTFSSFLYYR
jgi:cation:H+ antiporter